MRAKSRFSGKGKVTVKEQGEKPKSIEVESTGKGAPRMKGRGRKGGLRDGTGPRAKAGLCRRSKFSRKCGGKV